MSQVKRMIYIWPENLEFYNSIDNKSDFINRAIAKARIEGQESSELTSPTVPEESEEVTDINDPRHPDYHPDPRIRDTRSQINQMDARNKASRA